MNVRKGHNVFSDIPGFDATRGERIFKALQRLWAKIECLEQIRISERKSRSKEVQTSSSDEDLSITDVQYKLLVLQLQYARSILRKKFNKNAVPINTAAITSQDSRERNGNNQTDIDLQNFRQSPSQAVCQETQTGISLIEGLDPVMNADSEKNEGRVDAQISTDGSVYQIEDAVDHPRSISHRTVHTSSKPHYHLKLDDVPFLLAASTSASHSVVANVQNIIARMKTHSKPLCGSRHTFQRVLHSRLSVPGGHSQDSSKMLNKLSQDLHELSQKQEKLVKRFDSAQLKSKSSLTSKMSELENKDKGISEEKLISSDGPRRIRSNSESTKVQAEVKNVCKLREKDVAKYNAQQQKQIVCSSRSQSNLPIMARRQLLRSLQNFKSHLSEEDISWE